MALAEFTESISESRQPPPTLSQPLKALWLCKVGRWEDAHLVAQDIHTPLGSWIHALLHLIEGDLGNAGYWYRLAGRPAKTPTAIDAEW